MVDSPVRTGLQRRGRFIRLSRSLVYINTSGRTCLDELFIEYEQVTTWETRFLFRQIRGKLSYIINRRLHWMVQWAGAQVATLRFG